MRRRRGKHAALGATHRVYEATVIKLVYEATVFVRARRCWSWRAHGLAREVHHLLVDVDHCERLDSRPSQHLARGGTLAARKAIMLSRVCADLFESFYSFLSILLLCLASIEYTKV